MLEIKATFRKVRDAKNTYRYEPDQEVGEAVVLGAIYLPKSHADHDGPAPELITVTFTPKESSQ